MQVGQFPTRSLGPANCRIEELPLLGKALDQAGKAWAERPTVYETSDEKRLIQYGLRLGRTAVEAAERLAPVDPYWACVCARPYLEHGLRLLWAVREFSGIERLLAHHVREFDAWSSKLSKIAEQDGEPDSRLAEIRRLFQLSKTKGMPDLRGIIEAIARRDTLEGTTSLFADKGSYERTVGFLHMFSHANVLFLEGNDHLTHAVHAMMTATVSVVRSIGYRMGWDQQRLTRWIHGASSLLTLPESERALARRTVAEEFSPPKET